MAGDALLGREMGRYRIESIIGSGGFATVYRAVDLALERPIALKVVDPTAHRNPTIARRFVLEGRAVASLDHPAIVPVYDAGESDGVLWMAMRLIPGGSLDDALVAGRRFTFEQVAAVAARIGHALDHAHGHGIVHRDVKPSNILLEQNDPARAWLADFGIAATTRTAGRYTTGALGTAAYMAPEQAKPSSVGPPADLYSLGCVAYELLTRRRPFPGDDYVELLVAHASHPVPPTAWPRVDAFLHRALAKDPAGRPPSGGAFAAELRATLADTDRAGPLPPAPPPPAGPAPHASVPAAAVGLDREVGHDRPAPGSGTAASPDPGASGAPPERPPAPPPYRPGDPVGQPGGGAAGAARNPPAAATGRPPDPGGVPTVVEHVDSTMEHPHLRLPPPPAGPAPGPATTGYRPPPPGSPPAGLQPAPPAPRDPTVVRSGRRRAQRRLIVGGILLAVGVVAGVVALLDQQRQGGGRRVVDPAGISYDVPAAWSAPRVTTPPDVVIEQDGVQAATITHGQADGRSAAEQLDAVSPDICQGQPDPGPDIDIPGAEQIAECRNTSGDLPSRVIGAIAGGQLWIITVEQGARATEGAEFVASIELRGPATSAG